MRRASFVWPIIEGNFWRVPVRTALRMFDLHGADSPWNRGYASSPWPSDFPTENTFYFVIFGQLNEAMFIALATTLTVLLAHRVATRFSRKRA